MSAKCMEKLGRYFDPFILGRAILFRNGMACCRMPRGFNLKQTAGQ